MARGEIPIGPGDGSGSPRNSFRASVGKYLSEGRALNVLMAPSGY